MSYRVTSTMMSSHSLIIGLCCCFSFLPSGVQSVVFIPNDLLPESFATSLSIDNNHNTNQNSEADNNIDNDNANNYNGQASLGYNDDALLIDDIIEENYYNETLNDIDINFIADEESSDTSPTSGSSSTDSSSSLDRQEECSHDGTERKLKVLKVYVMAGQSNMVRVCLYGIGWMLFIFSLLTYFFDVLSSPEIDVHRNRNLYV